MIPKIFKSILREKKKQIACIYERRVGVCGTLRSQYIGETEDIFSERPVRAGKQTGQRDIGEWDELRRLEAPTNKKRRLDYEAALIIKRNPRSQRIHVAPHTYAGYFNRARRAGLLRMSIKHPIWRDVIAFQCYTRISRRLENFEKNLTYNIRNIIEDYQIVSLEVNKEYRKYRTLGIINPEYELEGIGNYNLKNSPYSCYKLHEEFQELGKMFKRYKKYLVHFEVEPPGVAALLRRKPQHGKFAKHVDINIENLFLKLKKTFKFCSHIHQIYSRINTGIETKKFNGGKLATQQWRLQKECQLTPEQIMKYGKKYKEAFSEDFTSPKT